jgi:hypothetical protein
MSDVDRWKATIRDLETKLATERERATKLCASKRCLSLKAHTGNGPASRQLQAWNRELLSCRAGIEDLEAAAEQARGELRSAEVAAEWAEEAERQRTLGELAERQLVQAGIVAAAIRALGETITELEKTASAMAAIKPRDDAHYRRVDVAPPLALALQAGIGRYVGMSARSRDPRYGRPLEVLLRERLGPFLLAVEPEQEAA